MLAFLRSRNEHPSGTRVVHLADGLDPSLGRRLAEPDRLLDDPGTTFLKDHRHTAVAEVRVGERHVFVKRFKPYAWYRRLGGALFTTPARRAWRNSIALEAVRFRVAPALAAVDVWRGGLPADGYFVTAAVPGTEPGSRLWHRRIRGEGLPARRRFLRAAARHLRRFHDAGFYTRDANADNFLVRLDPEEGIEVFHLDLENVRRLRRVSRSRRVKNLVQLYRLARAAISRNDRLAFVTAYLAGTDGMAPANGDFRDWLARLDQVDREKERKYQRRWRNGRGMGKRNYFPESPAARR